MEGEFDKAELVPGVRWKTVMEAENEETARCRSGLRKLRSKDRRPAVAAAVLYGVWKLRNVREN